VKSRTTHKTSQTQKSSSSRSSAPLTEFSLHEKEREVRRERAFSRQRHEFETYQYIEAPKSRSTAIK
jgi:hypothetical protein